ncbi:transposable element Tcb2 transposase [Trichonephila clavipes]|nr:transposable element Tcb2 transposase [Trichonephila clavipes]
MNRDSARTLILGVLVPEILERNARFFRSGTGSGFLVMDDNAHLHIAQLIDDYLESENIHRMDLILISPGLSSTGHPWETIGKAATSQNPHSIIIQKIKTAFLEELNRMLQTLFSDLSGCVREDRN